MKQYLRTNKAYKDLLAHRKFNKKISEGECEPNYNLDIDDDEWIAFNNEFYKLKGLQTEFFDLKVIRETRKRVQELRETKPAWNLMKDWKKVTQDD